MPQDLRDHTGRGWSGNESYDTMKLRSHLILLVIAAVLPVVIFAAVMA
jgi:hypothetical protein